MSRKATSANVCKLTSDSEVGSTRKKKKVENNLLSNELNHKINFVTYLLNYFDFQ